MTDVLRGYTDWPHAHQFAKITRSRTVGRFTSTEIEYLVTSLAKDEAGPVEILAARRDHWGIESRLFCVRDVTLGEDRCRVRTGSGPQVFAALRNAAIGVMRRLDVTNVAAAARSFMMNAAEVCRLVRYGRTE